MQVFMGTFPECQSEFYREVGACGEVMLKPSHLCRIVAGVEKKGMQIKFDRMDRDHTKRCARFRLLGSPIFQQ